MFYEQICVALESQYTVYRPNLTYSEARDLDNLNSFCTRNA